MVTGEMVEELILSGADIIKVGIGPGDHNYRQGDMLPYMVWPLQGQCVPLVRRPEWVILR